MLEKLMNWKRQNPELRSFEIKWEIGKERIFLLGKSGDILVGGLFFPKSLKKEVDELVETLSF